VNAKDFFTPEHPAPPALDSSRVLAGHERIRETSHDQRIGLAEPRSEQAIRASELCYRRVFEAAKDGILILDAGSGRINDANPFLSKLLGFSREEMLGKTVGELSPFKDIESNQIMLERLQSDGYVRYEDLPLETKDGRQIAVEFVSNAYQAGNQRMIQCNIRDITERKKAQNHSFRLAAIIESSDDAIIGKDLNGIITSWNKGAERIFGFTTGEMVGTSMLRLIPVDRYDEETAILGKIRRGENVGHFETRRQTKDGRLIDVSITASPIKDAAGQVFGVSKVAHDISLRKEAEAAGRSSEARYRTLFNYAPDGILLADPKGCYLDANASMCRMLGYTREELVGLHARDIVAPAEFPHVAPALAAIAAGPDYHREWLFRRKDGSDVSAEVIATTMPDGNLLAMIHDLSERKAAAEKLAQLNVELEHRVTERTEQLQAANEELEAFSYSVSHDLRAPLRHVAGFVELLQKDAGPTLSEKNLRFLATISQSAKRMGNLIDDLLAFSKVGRSEMQKTQVNLDELVRETVADLQPEIKNRKIAWTIHPLPPVQADRALMRMALVNLISNAIKFTGARAEAAIEIGCAPGQNGTAAVFVRDNGAGFDPKYAEKLFGVFQRLHSQDEFEGTGIGLANVKRIISRHGGRVWAEGAVEGGATFWFSIPPKRPDIHER